MDNDSDVEILLGLQSFPGFVCYNTDLGIDWQANVDTESSTQCVALVDVTSPSPNSGIPDGILDCVSLVQSSTGNAGINVVDGTSHLLDEGMSERNLGWGMNAHDQGSIVDLDGDGYYEMTVGYSPDQQPAHFAHIIRISSENINDNNIDN